MNRQDHAAAVLGRRSPLALRFMEYQFLRQLRCRFNAIRLSNSGPVPPLAPVPVVIYTNHAAWWDAVTYFFLSRRHFADRTGYGPIDAAQLKRYPILDRLGLFGIDPDHFSGAATFLSVARALFKTPQTLLWVSAEGYFVDVRARPVVLRPGISHLARREPHIQFLPLAIEYTFWDESRPELLLRFGKPIPAAMANSEVLTEALTASMDALAVEAISRDAALFFTLKHGRSGIGGIYDMLRRASALTNREANFDLRHRGV